jgi:hypothetical protein
MNFILLNSLYLIYILYVRPIIEGLKTEIFNEICSLLCSVMLLIFTDFVDDPEIKFYSGYVFIGIYIINFLVNFIVILIDAIKTLSRWIKYIYWKIKIMMHVRRRIHELMTNKNKATSKSVSIKPGL